MAAARRPRIPEFDPDKLELPAWLDLFSMNCAVSEVTEETAKRALLLSSVGVDTFSTICKLTAPNLPSAVPFDDLVSQLKSHFITKPSYHRALCDFLQRKKKSSESVKEYYAELKLLAHQCEFNNDFDRRLKEQLLVGIDNEVYFKVLLADPFDFKSISSRDLLAKVTNLETAYVTECKSTSNSSTDNRPTGTVNKVRHKAVNNSAGSKGGGKSDNFKAPKKCSRCGHDNHVTDNCKFKNAKCFSCGKVGHVSTVCPNKKAKSKSRHVNTVHDVGEATNRPSPLDENFHDSYDLLKLFDINVNSVDSVDDYEKPYREILKLNGFPIEFELDTGSGASTISHHDADKLHLTPLPTRKRLANYDKVEMEVYGEINCNVSFKGQVVKGQKIYVVNNDLNLAGRSLLKKLKYQWVQVDKVCDDKFKDLLITPSSVSKPDCLNIFREYHVDEGSPITNYECHLMLKENAVPKYFKARSVPYHYKCKIENSLQELESKNIVSKVEHAGDWASPIVPVIKPNGEMRICVDFKYLNTQTSINTFPLPKLDDILANLGSCQYIFKLDLKNAYLQLSVSENSQQYLVMNTHLGLYKFHRLPFGLSSAPGIFQRFITELLTKIKGVHVFLDDILIVGANKEEHDKSLCKVLSILQQRNVKLNKDKCIIGSREVPYLGYILSCNGIKPDPKKIEAILEAPTPKSVQSLKSFLRLCTYYNRFVPRFSSILCPLYNLTLKNVEFHWSAVHKQAFLNIKEALGRADILDNFNPSATMILEVDASPVGVGAVLKQEYKGKVSTISFKSRKLSNAECNYSQIDREALSIISGVKKFSDFLLGREFIIRTDHKPLIHLFNPSKSIPQLSNARIQRWALFLSGFDFKIEHIKGANNTVADALSKLPLCRDDDDFHIPGEYVNLINILDKGSFDFSMIKEYIERDTLLCRVRNFVRKGFPSGKDIEDCMLPFFKIRNDLSLHENVLLYRNRILVPEMLRKRVMEMLHDSHKGIVAMKAEARSFVYWPNMDQDLEQITSNCESCLTNLTHKAIPPLSWPAVDRPWSRLHVDYCGPIDNIQYLIIIDSFSKFIDVYACKNITSEGTIQCLRSCFANYGIPDTVVSDNATCFMSRETQEFFKKNGVRHCSGAPYNPSTNGLAERAVRIFKTNFKKFDSNLTVKTRIAKFLYTYRRTVQSSTGCSPAELLFGRKFKGPLDVIMPKQTDESYVHESNFKVGDAVYARNFGKGPEWVEAKITKVLGKRNYLVAVDVNGILT